MKIFSFFAPFCGVYWAVKAHKANKASEAQYYSVLMEYEGLSDQEARRRIRRENFVSTLVALAVIAVIIGLLYAISCFA